MKKYNLEDAKKFVEDVLNYNISPRLFRTSSHTVAEYVMMMVRERDEKHEKEMREVVSELNRVHPSDCEGCFTCEAVLEKYKDYLEE